MSSPSNIVVLIGEIAAIIGVTLIVCLGIDTVATALGYHPAIFCTGLSWAIAGAYNLGSICVMLGVIIWAMSRFRSEAGLGMMIGGVLLAVFPTVIPHYLGVLSCIQ
ncbi:hypothetical protein [Rhizobium brockwellii]|uniref:hypothetical protein n=1 Tax=Rhizobium brockwellii TaxID=3019932 RepID=UPI00293DFFDD|nr:hypothetical protein [Rhizobium brockwellii]MDV4159326.1 hypothetical protein [Rhizobium brockwellii]